MGDGRARPPMPGWVKVFVAVGIVAALLAILLLTGVLGKGHGPGRHLGGGSPGKRHGSVGAPAGAGGAARVVEISALDTMAFEPSTIAVTAGEAVTLSVTNRGKAVHELTLGDATMQRKHAEAMAHIPAGLGHDTPNSITLQPGETKSITWRFRGAGALEYACHQRGHYEAGMRGRITVS